MNGEPVESNAPVLAELSSQPYPLIFATISGAHLYGFPSPDSDIDLRGVHVLPASEILGLNSVRETIETANTRDDVLVETVTHDIKKFIFLLLKNNGYVIEQLFSPLVAFTTPDHAELKRLGKLCITRKHSLHYAGFAQNQWKLLQKKPTVKRLLYLYRVLFTGIHLMNTGEVEANLVALNQDFRLAEVPDLIARKLSAPELTVVEPSEAAAHEAAYRRLEAQLREAAERSSLPDDHNMSGALNDLLLRIRTAS